jgi:GNAT superfamily N-acetyltransferase
MVTIASYATARTPRDLPLASAATALLARQYRALFGVDHRYEADTCRELGEFLAALDERHDGFWWVQDALEPNRVLGCAGIDGSARQAGRNFATLRWVMLDERLRGQGLGTRLVDLALAFCRRQRYKHVTLTTHAALRTAVRMYQERGFRYTGDDQILRWGPPLTMQRFVLDLSATAPGEHAAPAMLAA